MTGMGSTSSPIQQQQPDGLSITTGIANELGAQTNRMVKGERAVKDKC